VQLVFKDAAESSGVSGLLCRHSPRRSQMHALRERRGLLTHPVASLGFPFWRRGTAPRQPVFVTDPKSFYGKKSEEKDR
jgi:hypothetical protein